jgi:hypothetical protein
MRLPRRPTGVVAMAAIGLAGLSFGVTGGAAQTGAGAVPAKSEEPELRAIETAVLGPDHAAEHAQDRTDIRRGARRWRQMTPAQRKQVQRQEQGVDRRLARVSAAAGSPDEVGAWTTAPFDIPAYAIHSVVLPTGKVLFWSFPFYPNDPNEGRAYLWDPSKGTGPGSFTDVRPPLIDVDGDGNPDAPAMIFCSGQSFLPNGDVLVAGGTLAFPGGPTNPNYYLGLDRLFTFDPWSESWIEQPRLRQGRWYPSQVELADGRTAILSGTTDEAPGGNPNSDLEVFTPSASPSGVGTLDHVASGDRLMSYYPHLFVLPTGNVLLAGPGPDDSALLDTGGFTWSDVTNPSGWRAAGTAVLRPQGPEGSSVVTQIGGVGTNPNDTADNHYGVTSTETIDASQPAASWHPDASLNVPRAHANTVLLPNGSMVEVGGGQGWNSTDGNFATLPNASERQVELYDPATDSWRLGPAQQEDRTYHSTAVLLPDGRVMSAGDNFHPLNSGHYTTTDTAEIYSPPYLFKGSRPVIGFAPDAVRWGDEFGVHSQSDDITRAVLTAPDATTHSTDMSQRLVPLRIVNKVPGEGVNVVAPPSSAVAPPGYYMLFLLNGQGVPSVARWVRLDGTAPDQPSLDTGAAAPPAARAAAPHVSVSAASTRRALRRRGRLSLNVTLDGPGDVELSVRLGNPRAKRSVSRHGSLRMNAPGSGTVTLDFPKAVRPSAGSSVLVGIRAAGPQGDATSSTIRLPLRR